MKMSRHMSFTAFALSLAALTSGCGASAPSGGEAEGGAGSTPTAKVKVVPVRQDTVVETVEAYGTAAPAPGATHTVSVPFEARVRRVLVTEGASVSAGTALVEIEPSPETALQLDQARDEASGAADQQRLVAERLGMHLATREDLLAAEQRLRAATLRVQNLAARIAAGERVLRTDRDGIVAHIDAQPGQLLAAGSPLLETVRRGDLTVRLGIETADTARVRAGQAVMLEAVNEPGSRPVRARVEAVASAVNHETRLVDVFAASGPGAVLRLNAVYRGRIETGRRVALVVPREALVPGEADAAIFTVEKGHAVRHVVRPGIDDGRLLEIAGPGLVAGASAVTEGNAELADGMAVDVDADATRR